MLGLWYTEKLKQENVSIKEINNFGFVTAYVREWFTCTTIAIAKSQRLLRKKFCFPTL